MKNQFDLIIFDWDGTLIDTIDWIAYCLQIAGKQEGYCVPEAQAAKDVIGLCIDSAIENLYPEADFASQRRMVKIYSELYSSLQLSRDNLFPGVFEMLTRLSDSGFKLAIATGKTRNGLNHALAATGTESIFSVTRCADETASKPNPRMLQEIMNTTGIAAQRTLMIGDSIHDLQMASFAGVSSVGVTCGANDATALSQYAPLLCLDQPAELLGYFN